MIRHEYVEGRDYVNGGVSDDKYHIGRNELDISKLYKRLIDGRKNGTYVERVVELGKIMKIGIGDHASEWLEILNWKQHPTRK